MRARLSPTLLIAIGLGWWFARGGAVDSQFLWPLCLVSHLVELGVAVVVGLALLQRKRKAGVIPSLCALLVLVAFVLSSLRSPISRLALERFPPVLLFLSAFALASTEDTAKTLHLLAAGALLPLLIGLVQIPSSFLGEAMFTVKGVPRIWSTFNHPNDFAFFLSALLPMILGLALISPPSGKVLFWPYTGLVCVCLVFTFSRAGWLGALAGAGALLLAMRGRLSRRALKAVALGAFVGGGLLTGTALALGFGKVLVERLLGALSPRDPTAASRLLMWERSLPLFLEHPLTGFGPGMFGLVYSSALQAGDFPLVSLHAHNTFVHLLVEQGLLGLVALSIVMGFALRGLKSQEETKVVAGASVAGAAVASFFSHSIEIPSIGLIFWSLLGATLSIKAEVEQREKGLPSRLLGMALALGGLVLTPIILKVDLAHRLYDKAREWRLPPLVACEVMRKAATLDPSMPLYWAALGEASFRVGLEPGEFLSPLSKAKTIAPFDPWLRRLHYWALYRAGWKEGAASEAKWVSEKLSPASGLFRCDAAWLLERAERKDEALRLLTRPLHLSHKAAAYSLLSEILEREGRGEEATKALRRTAHFLRYYQPPGSLFSALYLRLPFEESLPAFKIPTLSEMEQRAQSR